MHTKLKIVIVGAGPVGSLAALYAAKRGHDVEVYELRPGISFFSPGVITEGIPQLTRREARSARSVNNTVKLYKVY
jgi:flavin-dependent dehydrogenase